MSDTPWLDKAITYLGTREDHNNPVVLKFFAEAAHPEIKSTSVAWCAAFTGAMLFEAGYKNTGSLAARSYAKYGTKLDQPKRGCIVVFPRSDDPGLGHVGIVEKVQGDKIIVISGNEHDSVSRDPFPISRAIAFRWPIAVTAAKPAVEPKPITKSKIAKGGGVVIATETADAGFQINDAIEKAKQAKDAADGLGLTDVIVQLAHNPRFWVAVAIILIAGAIIYWRWRDHQTT